MLQGRMQARPPGTWHKHRLLRNYCHRHTVKLGMSQYEERQRVKLEEKRLYKKTVCLVDQLRPSYVPNVARTATPELVFTATTDTVQWVQIYGLTRLTDANE